MIKFELIRYDTIQQIISHIKQCEGQHIQQVAYSSYHNALTQICFDCKKVRSNMRITAKTDSESKSNKKEGK